MADAQIAIINGDPTQIAVIDGDQTQIVMAPGENPAIVTAVPGPQGPAGAVAAAIDGSAALPSIAFASDTDTGLYRVGANQLGVSTGGTQRLVIDSNGQIEATSLGTAAAPTWTFVGDPNTGIYSPGADQIAISTAGSGRLFVDSSGRLLIGTSSISVACSAVFQGNSGNISGAAIVHLQRGSSSIGLAGNSAIGRLNFADNAGNLYALIECSSDADAGSSDYPGRLVFSTTADGGAAPIERLRITSAGLVGVGTISPGGLLHVQSNLAGNNQLILTNIASSNSGAGSEIVFTQGASGFAAGKIQCDREGAYSTTVTSQDSALAFFTATDGVDSEKFRITSAGLVGVGTSAPRTLFNLASATGPALTIENTSATVTGTGSYGSVDWYGNDASTGASGIRAQILASSRGSSGECALDFGTSTTGAAIQTRMRIDSTGLVGIGTTSPTEALTVARLDSDLIARFGSLTTNTGAWIRLQGKDAAGANNQFWDIRNNVDGSLSFNGNTSLLSERLRIDSSGRLLVGTSTSLQVSSVDSALQLEGTNTVNAHAISAVRHGGTSAGAGAVIALGRSRGTSSGSRTAVANGDTLGSLVFAGANGTDFSNVAALIRSDVDGEPFTAGDTTDLPGRLVFSTTADGAASPTERMRIKANGTINFSNVAVYADNAAATTGGLDVGDVYRTSTGQLMIRY